MIPPRRLRNVAIFSNEKETETGSGAYVPKDKVKRRLLLDVVIAEGATVLELFTSKDEALLVRGDTTSVRARFSVPIA
jgi:hypothetical protein